MRGVMYSCRSARISPSATRGSDLDQISLKNRRVLEWKLIRLFASICSETEESKSGQSVGVETAGDTY